MDKQGVKGQYHTADVHKFLTPRVLLRPTPKATEKKVSEEPSGMGKNVCW